MTQIVNGVNLDEIEILQGGHDDTQALSKLFCVMELAAFVAGRPHSASPACVSPYLSDIMITWNDSIVSHAERQKLKALIPDLIGTRPITVKTEQPIEIPGRPVQRYIAHKIHFTFVPWLLETFYSHMAGVTPEFIDRIKAVTLMSFQGHKLEDKVREITDEVFLVKPRSNSFSYQDLEFVGWKDHTRNDAEIFALSGLEALLQASNNDDFYKFFSNTLHVPDEEGEIKLREYVLNTVRDFAKYARSESEAYIARVKKPGKVPVPVIEVVGE